MKVLEHLRNESLVDSCCGGYLYCHSSFMLVQIAQNGFCALMMQRCQPVVLNALTDAINLNLPVCDKVTQ